MKKPTAEAVASILNRTVNGLKITENNLDDDLTGLGMDSIAFIQAVVALEEEFECEIPDSKLMLSEMDTANKILQVLWALQEE